jgi:hypothetical protein
MFRLLIYRNSFVGIKYRNSTCTNFRLSPLSGVVDSVLSTGPKVRELKHGRNNGFLTAIKIHITPSFGWDIKPEAPCRKILEHVTDL